MTIIQFTPMYSCKLICGYTLVLSGDGGINQYAGQETRVNIWLLLERRYLSDVVLPYHLRMHLHFLMRR